MLQSMYPFWSAIIAMLLAQFLKPFSNYFITGKLQFGKAADSGGFPSSHSSMVTALAVAVGIEEAFHSTIFAVTATLALIVIYDAANVRFYSGQNARITQQLVKDLRKHQPFDFTNPIYEIRLKDVLGHKWTEIIGGILLGALVAVVLRNLLW